MKVIHMNKKLISIREETRSRLKALGSMGDTYDTVIQDLIDNYTKPNGNKVKQNNPKRRKKDSTQKSVATKKLKPKKQSKKLDKSGWKTTFDKNGILVMKNPEHA